jgi:hypothetical protein
MGVQRRRRLRIVRRSVFRVPFPAPYGTELGGSSFRRRADADGPYWTCVCP